MPDVASRFQASGLSVVVGDFYPVQDPLGGGNLVGSHHEEQIFCGEDAVAGEDVQEGVPGKEGFGKIHQVGDGLVACVGPVAGEFEAVAGFFVFFAGCFDSLLNVLVPGGVGIGWTGGNQGHSNLQPYITCYFWKRTG